MTNKRRQRRSDAAKRRLATLTTRDETITIPPYKRSYYGSGWADNDGDGQDERAETLEAAHRDGRRIAPIVYATEEFRRVVRGRWRCRFSGEWVRDASELDIDHLVPLAETWVSGAHAWDDERRERYANGVGIRSWRRAWLLPVKKGLNRSKGAKRPDQWLPPNESYRLNYAADWIATKKYWSLSVLPSERATLLELLEDV